MKQIFTKILKSKTLLFNWLVTVLALAVEIALQFAPEIKQQLSPEYGLYFIIFVTFMNKLLRLKTDSSLGSK